MRDDATIHVMHLLENLALLEELGYGGGGTSHDTSSQLRDTLVCERVQLQQVLAGFSEADRELVRWLGLEGLSRTQAAARLGLRPSALRQRLWRMARRIVREVGA